jgi:hypothetical protein
MRSGALQVLGKLRARRTALAVQGGTLRLLVMEGKRVRSWAMVPFNPALTSGGFIRDAQGMAQVIRNAVSSKGIPPAPVLAAFPATQSVVRLLRLPAGRLDPKDAVPREARRLLAYSPAEQYIFWKRVPGTAPGSQYLVACVPKAPLKSFLDALKLGGLPASRVELAPLCLLKGLDQGQAVVANVEADSIDICLVTDSVPVLVRSLWLGDEPLSPDTAASRLAEELASTIEFYNDANPANRIAPTVTIHVAEGFPVEDMAPTVAKVTGRPVLPLAPPLAFPEGVPASALAVPAGLALGA